MAGITDVLRNLAGVLVQQNVGVYDEVNPITSATLPLIMLIKLPQSQDRAVTLNIVIQGSTRDLDTTDTYLDIMVQVRCRGAVNDPEDPFTITEAVTAVLNGITQYAAGTYTLVSLTRRTLIPNGQDDDGRYEVLSQFYGQITAH